jgi:hypothetical protein
MKQLLSLLLAITATAGDLQLTLPPVVYAIPDVQMSLYHDNLVLAETPEKYRFEITSDVGKNEALRWTVKPSDADVGEHPIEVKVKDASGTVLESGRTTLRVSPRKSGEGKSLRLLIVGDSLTHATIYPNEIANLLSRPGNPKWTMLGTHHPASALPTVNHEGYGGWKWSDFLTKYTSLQVRWHAKPSALSSFHPPMAKQASSICRAISKSTAMACLRMSSPSCSASMTALALIPTARTKRSTKCSTKPTSYSPSFIKPRRKLCSPLV